MGLLSSCVHKVSEKRNLVNNRLYQRQTVKCQSNGNRASSVSDLPAPAAQTSAVGTACSRLPWPAVLPRRPHHPYYSHRWSGHPSTHPLTRTRCYSTATVAEPVNPHTLHRVGSHFLSLLPPCHSLRRPRRRPPPWCSRRGMVNVINERHPSEVDCTWRG